jgi:hypothetical protein
MSIGNEGLVDLVGVLPWWEVVRLAINNKIKIISSN